MNPRFDQKSRGKQKEQKLLFGRKIGGKGKRKASCVEINLPRNSNLIGVGVHRKKQSTVI